MHVDMTEYMLRKLKKRKQSDKYYKVHCIILLYMHWQVLLYIVIILRYLFVKVK